ncbi:ATP-binding protein [Anaeromassilibacillus senegalensis]|uniref:ATP-binding protein n=1 Tax=Anaeromassilibacillus senegalensis TaxID=1673717 RepID=UPI000681305E|nr:ATP-binding protein [Anaeromassilibacillus senegalensis]
MKYPKKLEQRADEILASYRRAALALQDTNRSWLRVAHPEIDAMMREIARQHARLGAAKIRGRADEAQKMEAQISADKDRLHKMMINAGVVAEDLEPKYECPTCEDRGYVDGKMCACRQTILNQLVYEQLCDVSIARDCSFDRFSLHYYDGDTRQTMVNVLESCRRYARDFAPGARSLIFMGPPGLGKTHLSLSIADGVAHSGHLVMYASAPQLMSQLEAAKFKQTEDCLEYREVIYGCELLVIDDLGAEMVTRYTQSEIYDLINSRLNTARSTIISTNLTMNEIEKLYTNRVTSRIAGSYATVQFAGRDIRLQKRMEKVAKT